MASCELDYRFQTNSSESMDYDDTDSDDDTKLQIVENSTPGLTASATSGQPGMPRTLVRSLSAVESVREDYQLGTSTASDAVESLLLLGQGPVVNTQQENKVRLVWSSFRAALTVHHYFRRA